MYGLRPFRSDCRPKYGKKKVLEKEGYEVVGAYNGKDGLNIIQNTKTDVLITDIKMKDMDGIEVLERAKELYQDIEGIVITGFKEQDLAIRALRAGAIDYITKPVRRDIVFQILEKWLYNKN